MSSQRVIEVTVSPAGQVSVQTRGFIGSTCRQASAFIEKALGQVIVDMSTTETHVPEAIREKHVTRG